MISAIIETRDDEVRLAHALSALVPAATDGVVREVTVVDRGSKDGTLVVADAAGCAVARDVDLASVAIDARGDWLLFHSPAMTMAPDWDRSALAFADAALVAGAARSRVAAFRGGRLVRGWRGFLANRRAAAGLRRGSAPPAGEAWLVAKQAYLEMAAGREAVSASAAFATATTLGARRGG